jgi:hypothetical protein
MLWNEVRPVKNRPATKKKRLLVKKERLATLSRSQLDAAQGGGPGGARTQALECFDGLVDTKCCKTN